MSKDVRESLIAIGAAALFFLAAWAWFQLARHFAFPSWIPYTVFLAAVAALLVALWRRSRVRKTTPSSDQD